MTIVVAPMPSRLTRAYSVAALDGCKRHAAVGGGSAEAVDLVAAVDRVAAMEEDRIRHRGVVIQLRKMRPLQALRMVHPARRRIAGPGSGNRPAVARLAVHGHRHRLAALVDRNDNVGLRRRSHDRDRRGGGQQICVLEHGPPRRPSACGEIRRFNSRAAAKFPQAGREGLSRRMINVRHNFPERDARPRKSFVNLTAAR